MKYLVELVFGVGFLGLAAMVLSFALRFLLLTWAVRVVGNVVQGVLGLIKTIIRALIFVFGPAVLGGFVIGLALQIGMNLNLGGGTTSADSTMPVLVAFLAFFMIVAVRGWQWQARRNQQNMLLQETQPMGHAKETSEPADYPPGCEGIANAWSKAIKLAPERRDDLLDARATCGALLAAVELSDGLPDSAMIETATLIRNHLAALVESTERRLRGAKRSEKAAIVEEMAKLLQGFARRAQSDLAAAGRAFEDDAALRAYLTSQLFERQQEVETVLGQ
ncbi:hypothetical protein [Novosphingobium sp. Fuku2-ISO-50]|uniref:hypothetical protein n=1 Tax=Novosphingobium sp. Fuku2-ISO-50 TaxID=1739114 RepID=UPI00076D5F9C|nr:hypothetical protein [Novosphingobium sp. Fuku2-ISO-50]KUR74209.1 hypothetical protein AQZ50_18050 [Novosphingobium sp. Fuku2-ISO-50]